VKDNIAYDIERLLQYAQDNGLLSKWDIVEKRNRLMDLLELSEPYTGKIEAKKETQTDILNNILDYAYKEGLLKENTITYRDLMDAKIMGIIMQPSSAIIREFNNMYNENKEKATDWYYNISKASNYIRTDRIAKNLSWKTKTVYGDIDITINLSKPEKDPKAIAAAKHIKSSGYPKCLLCYENVGYQGRLNHPARQNHRVIPLVLDKEQWYMQYSPYVYYNEHCIVLKEEHVPMKLTKNTFIRLLDFIDILPHYFLGSNADLPIVGGSILSHDHFQGGRYKFPMEKAKTEKSFINDNAPDIKAGIVKWPMSVIRISSQNRNKLINAAYDILLGWREYNDGENVICAYTESDGTKTPHNTVTPIARKNSDGEYEFDLVLRNNRISDEHPDGIFHPHKELHHIKKENIGLIEVMGLAVLPGRLEKELQLIAKALLNETEYTDKRISGDEVLAKHGDWIKAIRKKNIDFNKTDINEFLKEETGKIFIKVLKDAGVFKENNAGREGFFNFLKSMGYSEMEEKR
jgi:UDPglucose--hexose-1-phosphate uridylyltransferase